jgi:hypothetical protein
MKFLHALVIFIDRKIVCHFVGPEPHQNGKIYAAVSTLELSSVQSPFQAPCPPTTLGGQFSLLSCLPRAVPDSSTTSTVKLTLNRRCRP